MTYSMASGLVKWQDYLPVTFLFTPQTPTLWGQQDTIQCNTKVTLQLIILAKEFLMLYILDELLVVEEEKQCIETYH